MNKTFAYRSPFTRVEFDTPNDTIKTAPPALNYPAHPAIIPPLSFPAPSTHDPRVPKGWLKIDTATPQHAPPAPLHEEGLFGQMPTLVDLRGHETPTPKPDHPITLKKTLKLLMIGATLGLIAMFTYALTVDAAIWLK